MDQRKVKIFQDEKWIDIKFEDLKNGNKFKLIELTGEEVKDSDGNSEFIAISDTYTNENIFGTLTIDIK